MNNCRLSYAQERAWVDWKKAPDNVAYNNPLQYQLYGHVDNEKLEQAIQYLVAKNAALRTYFIEENGLPRQVLVPQYLAKLDYTDLSNHISSKSKADAIIHQNIRRPFDLSQLPLFRFSLIKIAADEYIFILNIHHIVVDGRSVLNVLGDISSAYNATLVNKQLLIEQDDLVYRQYLTYEQDFWQHTDIEEYIKHWQNTLKNAQFETKLPTRSLAKTQGFQGERSRLHLDAATSCKLRSIARENRTTFFLLLMSAFKLLLYRYTGQNDLTVLYPIDIRPKDYKNLLGFFVNLVPMRTLIDENATFLDLIQTVKSRRKHDKSFEQLPLQKIIQKICYADQDGIVNPFNVTFISANFALLGLELNNIRVESQAAFTEAVKDEFSFLYDDSTAEIQFEVEYNTQTYPTIIIKQFAENYLELLRNIALNPAELISKINYIPISQINDIIQKQTGRQLALPKERCFFRHFEAQAQKQPKAIALEFEHQSLTYQALNERVNQFCHYLLKQNVKPADKIGVFLPRSIDLVVTLLAIQKVGATYIPLDIYQPVNRIRDILKSSEMKWLVGIEESAIGKNDDVTFLHLTELQTRIANEPVHNVDIDVPAENLLYIIYTSGTTGVPKGVGVRHYSLTNFLVSMANEPGICANDTLLAITTVTFDIAGLELYLPLFTGAKILLANNWQSKDSNELMKLLEREEVTLMQATPATWQMLINNEWLGNKNLKALCGGEPLTSKLATHLLSNCKELWNMYGPTETTIWSTLEKVTDPNEISIGKSIDNTTLNILDKNLQPVAPGVIGDIYIGGLGLAQGYIDNPNLTDSVFINNPFQEGTKIYFTGDLGYLLPDYKVKCLGRMDSQVKVRGFRIELGEIETNLLKIPQVDKAIVLIEEREEDDKYIVAYLSLCADSVFSVADFKRLLNEKLPHHMIPQHFIVVDEFPLSSNGKVDKKTLSKRYALNADLESPGIDEDMTLLEQELVDIWKSLLNRQDVGVNDNFFLIGGHSLLANQCIARLAKKYETQGLLQQFFGKPTIREFATCLSSKKSVERIDIISREQLFPLTKAQRRIWLDLQLNSGDARYHMAFALNIRGPVILESLIKALNNTLSRHEVFKVVFTQNDADEPVQLIKPSISFHPICLNNASTELINSFIKESFNLETGPLYRVLINSIDTDCYNLIFIFHHMIVDGVSIQLFLNEFCAAYHPSIRMTAESPEPLSIQFLDYVFWQNNCFNSQDKEKIFWQQVLMDHIPLQLPMDNERPLFPTHQGQHITVVFDAKLTKKLKDIAHQNEVSLYTLMLAQFTSFLFCLTGQEDVTIGTAVSGRNEIETEKLIGCFINLLPIRILFDEKVSFIDMLGYTHNYLIEAYAHQQLPFEAMVEFLREQNAQHPIFNVLFGFQQDLLKNMHISNAQTELNILSTKTSKYDLTFDLYEQGDLLTGILEYDTALFNEQTVIIIRDKYLQFVSCVVDNVQSKLFEFSKVIRMQSYSFSPQKRPRKPASNQRIANEELLLNIAKKHLNQNQVTLRDNFFNLGGHSLLAVKMVNEMKKQLALDIPLYLLFESTDFGDLFAKIQLLDNPLDAPAMLAAKAQASDMQLSANQKGIIYQLELTGKPSLYHIHFVLKFEGILNKLALTKALDALIMRHEALQTGFNIKGDHAVARLAVDAHHPLVLYSVLSTDTCEQNLSQLIADEVEKPFNLDNPPLMRAVLFENNTINYFLLVFHHLVMDEWSVEIYLQELAAFYNAFNQDKPFELPKTLQQYDYIKWQSQQKLTAKWQKDLDYWTSLLHDIEPMALPYDNPKIFTTHVQGAQECMLISESLAQKIKIFAREQHVSLYVTLLSFFKILIARLTGQLQISLTSVDNRRHHESLETVLGYLVNVFALSTTLDDKCNVYDTIKAVSLNLTKANQHTSADFVEVLNALGQTNSLASELFQIMFVLQDPHQLPTFHDLTACIIDNASTTSKYELTFNLRELVSGEIKIICEYKSQLFSEKTIQRFLNYYLRIIHCALEKPETNIFDLELLSQDEKLEIAASSYNPHSFSHENLISLFNQQVSSHGEKLAIYCDSKTISYLELDKISNQWASYLQIYCANKNIKGQAVAVCLERGIDFVVICLALLKLRLAYIPLDPNDSTERALHILNDSRTELLISHKDLFANNTFSKVNLFWIDEHHSVLKASDKALFLHYSPHDLAYIIYTSGTTGAPKGVMLESKSVANFVQGLKWEIPIKSTDKMLQFSSLTFDASVWEIWGSLLNGASLHIPTSAERVVGFALENYMKLHAISTAILTPTVLATLNEANLPQLNKLALGGEVLPLSLAQRWIKNRRLINAYGPTEASVCSNLSIVSQELKTITIGKPMPNVKTYVLDKKQNLVPMGVVGELYIGGAGLSRGYLHQDELTHKHFVQLSLFNATPERFYRTFDKVRMHDKELQFLGRMDRQVKLHGLRIELEAIESRLCEFPGISSAIVVIDFDSKVIAYLIATSKLNQNEISQFLKCILPYYMIPQDYVFLNEFPYTHSGKLDYRALPTPSMTTSARKIQLPSSFIEQTVYDLWQDLLKNDQLSVQDNFFEQGGNSLLVMQLLGGIQQKLNCELSIKEFFNSPTIAEISALIQKKTLLLEASQ